jgi:DNA mismatch repair protein MutS
MNSFHSRMGASDRILDGESTCMVEMRETAQVLQAAGSRSFVLLDEIGRGTSTEDGLSIAQAILEHLHDEVGCLTLFATHYHELSALSTSCARAQNASLRLEVEGDEFIFLRKLVLEPASSSHGLAVARLAGLPKAVLSRADELFRGFAREPEGQQVSLGLLWNESSRSSRRQRESQDLAKFSPLENLAEALSLVDLDAVSPKEAWQKLESLKTEAENWKKTFADRERSS